MNAHELLQALCRATQAEFEFLLALCDSLPREISETLAGEGAIAVLVQAFERWRAVLEKIEAEASESQAQAQVTYTHCSDCRASLPPGWLIPVCLVCKGRAEQ